MKTMLILKKSNIKMLPSFTSTFLIASMLLISNCGQKGPLYIEDEPNIEVLEEQQTTAESKDTP